MTHEMALLLLLWQEACLEHETENDKLLPGATSATEEEFETLKSVVKAEQFPITLSEFNIAYASFKTGSDRIKESVKALSSADYAFRVKVIRYLVKMASASHEDGNKNPISKAESKFIVFIQEALGVRSEDLV